MWQSLSAGPHPCSPLFPVWAPAVSRTWLQCPHGPCQPGQVPPPARVPHPATVIFSLFWSEHFLQKGARMGSDSISAPGSSMSRLLSAAQGGCEGLQEAGVQKPRALSPGACGLDSYESSIYTPAYGTSEMAVPWEVQWNHQELFCCLQRADGTKERSRGSKSGN